MKCNRAQSGQRSGFTLIELLTAVAIIALLATLLLASMGRIIGSSKEAATRVTLKKVHEVLKQQQSEFNLAMSGGVPKRENEPCLGLDASATMRGIVERKRLLREAFPQRLSDLLDANGNFTRLGQILNSRLTEVYTSRNGSAPTPAQLETFRDDAANANFSAELLWLIIDAGSAYGTGSADSDQFTTRELKDTDGDGLPELVDAWDQPLRFYRWPTRLIRPGDPANPANPLVADPNRNILPAVNFTYWKLLSSSNLDASTLGRDADDPMSEISRYLTQRSLPLGNIEDGGAACTFHTPDTYAPLLVVSSGPDLQLGLFEPNDVGNRGHLAQPRELPGVAADGPLNDDLTNLQGVE